MLGWLEGEWGSLRKARMWMGWCESEMFHLVQLLGSPVPRTVVPLNTV